MKKKLLTIIPSILLLAGCGTALINPKLPIYEEFKDARLNSIVKASKQRESSIKANVTKFGVKTYTIIKLSEEQKASDPFKDDTSYVSFDIGSKSKQELVTYINENVYAFTNFYCDLSEKSMELQMDALGKGEYGEIAKAVIGESEVTKNGLFNYLSDDLIREIYNVYSSSYLYSFGILDLINFYFNSSLTSKGVTVSRKITDSKWYEYLQLDFDNGNGNFTVKNETPFIMETDVSIITNTEYSEISDFSLEYQADIARSMFFKQVVSYVNQPETAPRHSASLETYHINVDHDEFFDITEENPE